MNCDLTCVLLHHTITNVLKAKHKIKLNKCKYLHMKCYFTTLLMKNFQSKCWKTFYSWHVLHPIQTTGKLKYLVVVSCPLLHANNQHLELQKSLEYFLLHYAFVKNENNGPGQAGQLVGVLSHKPTSCGYNPQSGHIPRLWVQSPIRAHAGGNCLMFLSHILFLSLSSPPSFPLSLKSIQISLGEDLKNKKQKNRNKVREPK